MHPIWDLVSLLTARQVYTRASARSNAIYLTFDDGPHPEHTPRVIDLLAKHRARATFFLIGERAEAHGDIVRALVAGDHRLGNHSFSHPSFAKIALRRQLDELDRTDGLLRRFDGRERHAFRPPYGRLRVGAIALCVKRRQPIALWTHDSLDFQLDPDAIVRRFTDLRLQPGDILLFHDDGPAGLIALEELLPRWRRAGFEFAAL